MAFQMLMIASTPLSDIEHLWMESTAIGFHQVTKIERCVVGRYGLCILDSAESPTADGALERFLLEHVEGENAANRSFTMRRLIGRRLPSDRSLSKGWDAWIRGIIGGGGPIDGKLDGRKRNAAIDAAIEEGLTHAFSEVKGDERLRQINRKMQAKMQEHKDPIPKVEVGSARQETIRLCQSAFKVLHHFSDKIAYLEAVTREGLLRDGLPPVAWDALERATSPKDEEAVVALLKAMANAVSKGHEDPQKHNRLVLLAGADPALFLPFCRSKPVAQEKRRGLLDDLIAAMESRFFGRPELVNTVAFNLSRRLAGDQTVLTLLLHGPPGTGKSYLVTQLADALTEAGVAATAVFQAMTEGGRGRGDEAVMMQLMGMVAHYSNSDCGSLYRSVKSSQNRLSLVLLDEAEKCASRDFLCNLLDPRLPLEDACIKGLVNSVDMRSKTVFFLSANDTAPLCQGVDDPVWSRLQPAWLRPYTMAELTGILERKIAEESPFNPGSREARNTVKRIMDRDGGQSSLRKLLDEVNNELFLLSMDRPNLLDSAPRMPTTPRKAIGFLH